MREGVDQVEDALRVLQASLADLSAESAGAGRGGGGGVRKLGGERDGGGEDGRHVWFLPLYQG